ncbi:MAG: DNA-directed RNA polymerase subunit omega [Clostridia bacterium]|nr:DNA-directed RNA polymerase subunit omega [Clostridia bacterium]MBQ9188230.1 DNA-directed RNA polymerase subunit omega [Clostridia bacterium]MBR3130707.1 DNA-directed RNA polymerase subunit omega [Clostridia bacterium]MBR3271215.1 DNA-directed RNA polymerase subunit omega [Clostridia bacterium]
MLNRPALNELVKKAGCRYLLVTAVATRARQLQDHPEKLNGRKPVSVAVDELYHGDITVTAPKEEQ